MDSEQLDICALNKGRETIYAFFSRLFLLPPSDTLYKELTSLSAFLKSIAEDSSNSLIIKGAEGLENFITKRSKLEKDELDQFDKATLSDYTLLFCLSDSVAVSQSVYVSAEHLTMQEPMEKASAIYDRNGFSMGSSSNEPSDHISYELMFLSSIAHETAKAFDCENDKEAFSLMKEAAEFIKDYPKEWFGFFYNALSLFPQSKELYAPAASFILGYIDEDKDLLEEIIHAKESA